jgi:Domain of unknown function (DUF5047)
MSTPLPSARHQAALSTATGYRRWSRLTFFRGGVTSELEPISGSFTQDARRNARWDGRLQFAGDDVLPRRPGDLLTPFGTRVEVELGLELLDGSVSSVPYGTYEISSSKVDTDAGSRVVSVGMIDVSDRVERYRFETPVSVASGTDLATMINTVVTNRTGFNPGVTATGVTLGAARVFGLDAGTAPWSEILDVLANFSLVAWYDRVGQIQVGSQVPDSATAYPLDLLTSLSSDYDTRPPNVVVARGEAQDGTAPVQAVAVDSDPSSPTYAGTGPGTSPYGRVTEFFSSPLLKTVGQAQSAADTILAQNVGAGATYTLIRPYDPAITAGDVVTLDGAAMAVDSVTLRLDGDTSLQVRGL